MPTTVAIGSVGTFVNELQRFLNELHSDLVRLKADGIFGPKTRERVMEFQSQNQLVEDGVVGPITWERLYELMVKLGMDLTDKTFGNNLGRQAVVAIANAEASAQLNVVAAKQSGGPDPQNPKKSFRKGDQHLQKQVFSNLRPKAGSAKSDVLQRGCDPLPDHGRETGANGSLVRDLRALGDKNRDDARRDLEDGPRYLKRYRFQADRRKGRSLRRCRICSQSLRTSFHHQKSLSRRAQQMVGLHDRRQQLAEQQL